MWLAGCRSTERFLFYPLPMSLFLQNGCEHEFDSSLMRQLWIGSRDSGLPRPLLKFSGGSVEILRDVL
jgi:hypothetical protein